MRVAGLFRFPVKGFTCEECESLDVLAGGRIAGDRVLGLRFNPAAAHDDAWSTKRDFVVLMNTPGLARLRLRFDHEGCACALSATAPSSQTKRLTTRDASDSQRPSNAMSVRSTRIRSRRTKLACHCAWLATASRLVTKTRNRVT